MIHATNGQQPAEPQWGDLDPLVAGVLRLGELGLRLQARLEANLSAAQMALEAAREEPWVEGSTGQLRAHPGFAVARASDEMAITLYKELTRGLDELIPELGKALIGRTPGTGGGRS
jgi:hypothetical protein